MPCSVSHLIMLEDDHIITSDFMAATRSLLAWLPSACAVTGYCGGVVLGRHQQPPFELDDLTHPFGATLTGHHVNLAMTVSRAMWRRLNTHARAFCEFDDYNWDLTLEMCREKQFLSPVRAKDYLY